MRITVYDGKQCQGEVPVSELSRLLASSSEIVWADCAGPSDEDVRMMSEVFKFHPLAIEDTRNQRQRPKIEEFEDHLFLILNAITLNKEDGVQFHEMNAFIGRNFLVTVHSDGDHCVRDAQKRISTVTRGAPLSPGFLLYEFMDVAVDSYFPVLDAIGDRIDEMEELVLTKPRDRFLTEVFRLRRTLGELWRVVGYERDLFNIVTHHEHAFIDRDVLEYYLRDVYDHLLRISDAVNAFRDLLTSMVELYMSAVSNRLNQVVNRLTVITVTVGMLTVVSGFYGMNFATTWPPFNDPNGVPFVIGLMLAVSGLVLVIFWRLRWFR